MEDYTRIPARVIQQYIDINSTYRNTSVELRSLPITSLSIYTTDGCLNRMTLSSFLSMKEWAFCNSSFNLTSVISPSNTKFCTQCKYLRHSFSILPTRFSPKSYTAVGKEPQLSMTNLTIAKMRTCRVHIYFLSLISFSRSSNNFKSSSSANCAS